MESKITRQIKVSVTSRFEPGYSDLKNNYYFFSYHITIQNHSDQAVQLLNRYWEITDCNMQRRVVKGAGVIGVQPIIQPGESHSYSSGCDFSTFSGKMKGYYLLSGLENERSITVEIPEFTMVYPPSLN